MGGAYRAFSQPSSPRVGGPWALGPTPKGGSHGTHGWIADGHCRIAAVGSGWNPQLPMGPPRQGGANTVAEEARIGPHAPPIGFLLS